MSRIECHCLPTVIDGTQDLEALGRVGHLLCPTRHFDDVRVLVSGLSVCVTLTSTQRFSCDRVSARKLRCYTEVRVRAF